MKKLLLLMLTLSIVLTVGVAVGLSQDSVTLRWGHAQPPTHPSHVVMEEIAKSVAEKTNGRVKIETYHSSQLGSAKDMIEGLIMGTQDLAYDGPGVMSNFLPKISIFEAPFLYDDYDHLMRVVNSPVAKELYNELLAKRGIRILDVWYYGVRHVTTNKVTLKTLNDFNGLKLRVPEIPLYLETMKALGVRPTPMPFGELYLALQTGVVNGQENPLETIDSAKLYEVQDNLALTGHITNLQFVMVSERTWKKIGPADQKVLMEAIKTAGKKQDKVILDNEDKLADTFKEFGVNVVEIDREPLRKAMEGVYKKFSETWGEDLVEKITSIK